MSDEIRITDLSRPQLDDTQRAAMAWAENLTIELSVDSVLGQARQTTGLLDFGPEDFIERLGLLCDEWSSDHELTALGRLTLRNKLVQHAGSRLLIQDSWTRHPEILDIAIERPIIVVGLPRSGTTHLLNTLAADPRLRSLPLWESYEPLPLPGEPSTGDENDPRWFRCQKAWEGMQSVTPHLAAMHPMNPDHVHEELELMGPDFASYNYEWLAHSPRWRDHYLGHDQQPHYDYMKNVLRLLAWRDQQVGLASSNRASGDAAQRWVLKCPQHLEQLPALTRTFPDATVVVTHRDPVAVIQSTVTMLAYGQRVGRRRVLMDELLEYWTARVEQLLAACVRDRGLLAPAHSMDLHFADFMADEEGSVAAVYQLAGLELDADTLEAIADYRRRHPRDHGGRVLYDLAGDFGTDPDELRKRFDFYSARFPVESIAGE
ncbi:MAG: sulfotransferase [Deltaproteobacteria bacterium]|jgi:hypothetical protein|nr:sulfotransferase [Deltaproteobacteria bacterium]